MRQRDYEVLPKQVGFFWLFGIYSSKYTTGREFLKELYFLPHLSLLYPSLKDAPPSRVVKVAMDFLELNLETCSKLKNLQPKKVIFCTSRLKTEGIFFCLLSCFQVKAFKAILDDIILWVGCRMFHMLTIIRLLELVARSVTHHREPKGYLLSHRSSPLINVQEICISPGLGMQVTGGAARFP